MVIVSEGDVGGVACPVPCGVMGHAGRSSGREVAQFGEDGCGDLGGELEIDPAAINAVPISVPARLQLLDRAERPIA